MGKMEVWSLTTGVKKLRSDLEATSLVIVILEYDLSKEDWRESLLVKPYFAACRCPEGLWILHFVQESLKRSLPGDQT